MLELLAAIAGAVIGGVIGPRRKPWMWWFVPPLWAASTAAMIIIPYDASDCRITDASALPTLLALHLLAALLVGACAGFTATAFARNFPLWFAISAVAGALSVFAASLLLFPLWGTHCVAS